MKSKWICVLLSCMMCTATAYAAKEELQPGMEAPYEAEEPAAGFSDVSADSWFAPQLEMLIARGAITGSGTFSPYENITVREYIEILVRCIAPDRVPASNGTDGGSETEKYLLAGNEIGLLTGFDCSEQRISRPLTRSEAAWLLTAAARCNGETLTAPEHIERALRDYRILSDTYRDAIGQAFGAGLLTSYEDRTFRDIAPVRRCDAVVSIARLLDKSQRVQVVIPDYDYGAPVPESAPVEDSFFANAVFIGDSLCDGFGAFSGLKQGTFMGVTSLNVFRVWDNGREQVFHNRQFDKIYIMLGINEIGYGTEKVAQKYKEMVQKFQTLQPQADIYVQSLLPVCEAKTSAAERRNHVTNYYVREMNAALQTVCEECQVYFVNLHEAFVDSSGGLPANKCWDNVHLNVGGYQEWLEYLRTHTVS